MRGIIVAASTGAFFPHCVLLYRAKCSCTTKAARAGLSNTTGTGDGISASGNNAFALRGLRKLGLSRFDVFPNNNTMCVDSVAVACGER